jgi:hypothetical protein
MDIFDETPRTKAERMGPDLLASASGITGGRTFPIHNLKKIGDAAAELSIQLRNQYLVAYRPNNLVHDGKWHNITVPGDTAPELASASRLRKKLGTMRPHNDRNVLMMETTSEWPTRVGRGHFQVDRGVTSKTNRPRR